jgi:hypothetical protein
MADLEFALVLVLDIGFRRMGYRKEPEQIDGYPVKDNGPSGAGRQAERPLQRR